MVKKIIKFILDIISPNKCLGCGLKNEIICDKCKNSLKKAERETTDNIWACFDYRDKIIKKAIWDLKYHNKIAIGEKLGILLYENFIEEISEIKMFDLGQKIMVIPVPISPKRYKDRGYNQTEKIVNGFCLGKENLFEIKTNIIFKRIETMPQAKITNKKKRLRNIQGAFELNNKNIIKNRTIFIIDDVTTTGGTITEIIKILHKNGAKKIIGLAIAH